MARAAHRLRLPAPHGHGGDPGPVLRLRRQLRRDRRILAIHRSTLRYRLQRIRDISGNDLANVEDRLNLQVATRVWKIVLNGRS
ncbi:helix-turn-helix domain-containing protein [Yinghuangia aomiensis]